MTKRTDREGPIHRAILAYLKTQFPDAVVTHAANEGVRGGKRGAIDGARRKAMGQLAGFPDLLMLWADRVWTFEVKAPGNTTTEAQQAVGAAINEQGGKWAVVRSVDEVKAVIARWLDEEREIARMRGAQ